MNMSFRITLIEYFEDKTSTVFTLNKNIRLSRVNYCLFYF